MNTHTEEEVQLVNLWAILRFHKMIITIIHNLIIEMIDKLRFRLIIFKYKVKIFIKMNKITIFILKIANILKKESKMVL